MKDKKIVYKVFFREKTRDYDTECVLRELWLLYIFIAGWVKI